MSDSDNKDLNIQLEDNEKSFYSDEQMVITSKRLVVNGVTTSMQAVKSAWIGVKKIPKWPGVLLLLWGTALFYSFYVKGLSYGMLTYPTVKYLILVFGIGYFLLRQKIAKFGVYVSGLNSDSDDSDEIAIAVSKDMDYLNTVMEAINKAIATQ